MPPKRGRKAKAKAQPEVVPVRDGYIELPHNMGVVAVARTAEAPPLAEAVPHAEVPPSAEVPPQVEAPPATATSLMEAPSHVEPPSTMGAPPSTVPKPIIQVPDSVAETLPLKLESATTVNTDNVQQSGRQLRPRKSKVGTVADVPSPNEAPHPVPKASPEDQLAAAATADIDNTQQSGRQLRPRKRKPVPPADDQVLGAEAAESQPKKMKKEPKGPYGLTPGQTPFPEWSAPSAEHCTEVFNLLKDAHGSQINYEPPDVIPAPSFDKTGCGEVPDVLDALLRTVLSGATTFESAKVMLNDLKEVFGELELDGVKQGTMDWNKVRLGSPEDVYQAIRKGGLAKTKTKHIKGILDKVYEENQQRRAAYIKERETGQQADVVGAAGKTVGQKEYEIHQADRNILSLNHLFGLSVDDAMTELVKYPGVGVKTAACLILFCLQRPCFAVDTHVFKFAKWLGWAPRTAKENQVFSHLEVRCPPHLKYGLHQLFIKHGQDCHKCKRSTMTGTEDWNTADDCPLENLLDRYDKRESKGKTQSKELDEDEGTGGLSGKSDVEDSGEHGMDAVDDQAKVVKREDSH
ncbi:DNA glycosylase [Hypoxylon fuscum]|nr:DNA glycosylase [Hypoxylon fuscum]